MASNETLQDVESERIDSNYDEVVESFDALNLKEELLRGKRITCSLMYQQESILTIQP